MMERARDLRAIAVKQSYEEDFLKAFDEHADALFRHASFRVSDREKAKDLTQDTFIKAWEYVREGGEIREWRSFLYRVLHNAIIDEYRRKKDQSLDALTEHSAAHTAAYMAVDGREVIEEAIDEALLSNHVRSLIPALPENQRAALTLRYMDGLSPREIAAILGVSENVASVRIHRALEHLKQLCSPLKTRI